MTNKAIIFRRKKRFYCKINTLAVDYLELGKISRIVKTVKVFMRLKEKINHV